ncbi:hypothetical protein [Martelella radicis]|uniref:Uncharacterized protein n=1 Tax=Martelella radicis TaxID=1397476 RepID=A0A7W6KKU0_9HYPH|nr:hypothetical protein [Martelella radicis]MBB4123164.1 hypothetical protein [Martelella radicis]
MLQQNGENLLHDRVFEPDINRKKGIGMEKPAFAVAFARHVSIVMDF